MPLRALAVAARCLVTAACGGAASTAISPSLPFGMAAQNSSGVIGSGSCASPGGIAYALLQVMADSHGQATATTRVAEDCSLPRTGWYVNVHLGPCLDESEYAPSVSCGDLPVSVA